MFRITVTCTGLAESEGQAAPPDIEEEFRARPWHSNPKCTWDGKVLRLTVINDYDSNGLAVLYEFRDAIHACINWSGEINVAVESVVESESPTV